MAPYGTVTTTISPNTIPHLPQDRYKKNPITTTTTTTKEEEKLHFSKEELRGYRSLWGTFDSPIKWFNSFAITAIHLYFLYGLFQYDFIVQWRTFVYQVVLGNLAGIGVTAGAHRLWCHRAYKANLPLRWILMVLFTMSGQNSLCAWVRDHRVHHKFSETDADPHNSNRGFFFAHCGWLMLRKHPEVLRRGRQVDMSDMYADPVIRFHEKHFVLLKILIAFVIPALPPIFLWNESVYWAFVTNSIGRYIFNLNNTWSVNSAAHLWGTKPYDKRIQPVENVFVAWIALGEGWHNYHHTFPWDYKAAELGRLLNVTTYFIDFCAKIGWVYDRKFPSQELVRKVAEKTGDGTHPVWGQQEVPESAEDELKNS